MRIKVKEAADMLGMDIQTVRILMQKERLPIGFAEKVNGEKWTYFIYLEKVNEFLKK